MQLKNLIKLQLFEKINNVEWVIAVLDQKRGILILHLLLLISSESSLLQTLKPTWKEFFACAQESENLEQHVFLITIIYLVVYNRT